MIDIVYDVNVIAIEKIREDVYLLRGYADVNKFPGKFEFVALVLVAGSVATLKGFLHEKNGRKVTIKQARSVDEFLRSIGCEIVEYVRSKDGVMVNVTRKL